MGLYDGQIFLVGPFVFLDIRVQMIMPSLSALLANSSRQSLCNVTPIFCAKLFDIISKPIILLLAPWSLYHGWIQNFLPPVQALDVGPLIEKGGNSLPVSSTIFLDKFSKFVVLICVPISFRVLWVLRILLSRH